MLSQPEHIPFGKCMWWLLLILLLVIAPAHGDPRQPVFQSNWNAVFAWCDISRWIFYHFARWKRNLLFFFFWFSIFIDRFVVSHPFYTEIITTDTVWNFSPQTRQRKWWMWCSTQQMLFLWYTLSSHVTFLFRFCEFCSSRMFQFRSIESSICLQIQKPFPSNASTVCWCRLSEASCERALPPLVWAFRIFNCVADVIKPFIRAQIYTQL